MLVILTCAAQVAQTCICMAPAPLFETALGIRNCELWHARVSKHPPSYFLKPQTFSMIADMPQMDKLSFLVVGISWHF